MAILGIDEVGRGPIAGPLVVGAAILPDIDYAKYPWLTELKDSKKLTPKRRESLNEIITKEATVGLGWVPTAELDQLGISKALCLATRRAVQSIQKQHIPFSQIIIDGKVNFLKNTSLARFTTTCIKADDKIREVSAASIVAKVARDRYMINLANKYPNYGFEKHVGYGTTAHVQAIHTYGLTPEHRRSFEPCKTLSGFTSSANKSPKNTTSIGQKAETAVADFLISNGHKIVEKNHRTYFYEIDLISIKGSRIYFTEVKYRKTSAHGSGLDAITPAKKRQMSYAATSYLKYTATKFKPYNPVLAVATVSSADFIVDSWFPLSE